MHRGGGDTTQLTCCFRLRAEKLYTRQYHYSEVRFYNSFFMATVGPTKGTRKGGGGYAYLTFNVQYFKINETLFSSAL